MSLELDLGQMRRTCSSCTLRELCLPAPIGPQDMNQLDQLIRSRRPLQSGEMLFFAGAPLRSLYVVRTGSVKSFHEDGEGVTQLLGFHLPGELLGLDALADEQHRCHVQALENTTLCEVPLHQLFELARQIPGFQRHLMRLQSREMGRDQEHFLLSNRKQAQERLVGFLLSLSQRYARLGFPADRIQLSMARADIANFLGLAVETISRLMTNLKELGVISVSRRTIRVLDFPRLIALSGTDEIDCQPATSLAVAGH